jgi:hypothetical protein
MERDKQIEIEITPEILDVFNERYRKISGKMKKRHASVVNDQPRGEDGLNYTDYANAFGLMLSDTRISLPITIGIYSSWGTGKSFLLGKIKEYIETNINSKIYQEREKNRMCKCTFRQICNCTHRCESNCNTFCGYEYIIIDFNAWSYSFSDVLWAGLVKEIHTKVEDRYGFLALRFFRFFIYPFRSNSRQKMACMILYGILRFLSLVIFTILLSAVLSEDTFVNLFGEVAIYSAFGLTIATIIPSIVQLIITLCKDKGSEIMKGAKNIAEQVGFMGDVRDELELICDFVKMKRAKFAVFIDDLDRCPPTKIVDMIDASMLLLSNLDYPFLTFITIDPRIIVKSIESSYDDVFHNCGITGFEYLDKLIQIPFSIPIASPRVKDGIIQILIREKEDVSNKVFELCSYFVKKDICFTKIKIKKYPNKKIYEIDEDKLYYTDKIEYIKSIYTFIIKDYKHIDDGKYVYDNTGDILKFMLKILRHLVSLNEENEKQLREMKERVNKREHKIENKIENKRENTKFNMENEISKYMYFDIDISNEGKIGELKNIIIDKAEDDIGTGILTSKMNHIFNRIKGLDASKNSCDVDFRDLGTFIRNQKNRETALVLQNNLNDIIIEFTKHFNVFMNTKSTRFSPIGDELNTLYVSFEQITRSINNSQGTLYAHSQSMLSVNEVEYFHEIAQYFDGNCRRNKRIINVYVLIKNILGDRITGWYKSCPVTIYTLKILIKIVVLFEQWPYRMCAIFQILENYKEELRRLPEEDEVKVIGNNKNENEIEIDTLDKWLDEHRFYTLQALYEHFPKCIMNSKENCNMRCYDYNHYVFEKFLNVEPIITVEYFYICIGYIFNINYSIKNMISNMLNEKNLIAN